MTGLADDKTVDNVVRQKTIDVRSDLPFENVRLGPGTLLSLCGSGRLQYVFGRMCCARVGGRPYSSNTQID